MGTKIWRYMDMTKFISLLVNEALYFTCLSDFDDPFEGHFPNSHFAEMCDDIFRTLEKRLANAEKKLELEQLAIELARIKVDLPKIALETIESNALRVGVNCWHRSEHESDAMWKLYSSSNQCIAIESSILRLKASITDPTLREQVSIGIVRYLDFENATLQEGFKHSGLFTKRKAFEHEKELRAVILDLPETGKGALIKCCLDTLIENIYLSPVAESFIKHDIEALLEKLNIKKNVLRSKLLDPPRYDKQVATWVSRI